MPFYGYIRARQVWLAAGLIAIAVAGCGSSSSTSSSSSKSTASGSSDASSSTAIPAAKALVAKFSAPQAAVSVPMLPSKPPAGKTVDVLTCGFPSCQATTAGVAAGAKALGWTVKTFTSPITPEGYDATWTQMLQSPPDAIVYTGLLPNSSITSELAKVRQLGIPTVAIAGWDPPGTVMKAIYSGIPTLIQSGKLMGAEVVADGGSGAKAVFVWDPTTLMGPVKDAFSQEVEGAGGSVSALAISTANVGTQVPGQVVNFLQAHPDVKYLVFGISDFVSGVPQAIKAAGITGVKIISRAAHPNDIADTESGSEWMSVAEETTGSGYRAVDALARIMEHVSFQPDPAGWARILTKSNLPSGNPDSALNTPGVPAAFLHAWRVS